MKTSALALLLPLVSARFTESHELGSDNVVLFPDDSELFHIELSPGETKWVTEDEKWDLRRQGTKFMDITEHPTLGDSIVSAKTIRFPHSTSQESAIRPLLKKLNPDNMQANLEKFTSFHTRYYKSDYGRQSSEWLLSKVRDTIKKSGATNVTAEHFEHPWGQNSVIATIPGQVESTVVIGAHQDSINLFFPSFLAAPGADDDGSGTVTILEAFRVFLSSDLLQDGQPENTVEFHWYSAEEGGLLGSQAIFSAYEAEGRDVKAMLQQDMTGYVKKTLDAGEPESVGVITDFVDPGLTAFIKKVIEGYCDIPYIETKCGYACSDHASASKAGYPSAFVIESAFDKSSDHIHTTRDVIGDLSFEHMLQHAKLTLGLVYELATADFGPYADKEYFGEL